MRGHAKATYNSMGPFALEIAEINGVAYVGEPDMYELIERLGRTAFVHPESAEEAAAPPVL